VTAEKINDALIMRAATQFMKEDFKRFIDSISAKKVDPKKTDSTISEQQAKEIMGLLSGKVIQ